MADARLSISGLDKAFASPVLERIDLSVAGGEIHALVGENGAGKSTLANILAGLVARDAGTLRLDGVPYEPRSPKDALRAGVSLATQELSVIETLTAAENIALRALPRRGLAIASAALRDEADPLLCRVGLEGVDPDTPAERLSLAERQLVELARAIRGHVRLLILDEPTAALTAAQAERVHAIMRELAADGVSVIYISHRLDDVLQMADTVTVLRDGRVAKTAAAADLSAAAMVELMTGRRHDSSLRRTAAAEGKVLLEARGALSDELAESVDLRCRSGEILGVAGLAGAGKSELLRLLFGLEPATAGSVLRHRQQGSATVTSARAAVRLGLGYLGEDRRAEGIYPGLSVLDNMMLSGARAFPFGPRGGAGERRSGRALIERMTVSCAGLDQDIAELSGGNQQKALLARWLNCGSEVLLLDEPTRGIDVGAKQTIYELLTELREGGRAIVVASSELDELMTICDRILVLSNRRLVAEFARGSWSEAELLAAAFAEYSTPSAAAAESRDR